GAAELDVSPGEVLGKRQAAVEPALAAGAFRERLEGLVDAIAKRGRLRTIPGPRIPAVGFSLSDGRRQRDGDAGEEDTGGSDQRQQEDAAHLTSGSPPRTVRRSPAAPTRPAPRNGRGVWRACRPRCARRRRCPRGRLRSAG